MLRPIPKCPFLTPFIVMLLAVVIVGTGCKTTTDAVDPTPLPLYNPADVVDIDTTDIGVMNTLTTSDGWHAFALMSSCKVVVYHLGEQTRDTFMLTPQHGAVTWGGTLCLDTTNKYLMVMDKTANAVSVWDWSSKSLMCESDDAARALLSPDGSMLLVQLKSSGMIKKVNVATGAVEWLASSLAKSSSDMMLGVDWDRQGVVMYTGYPLTTNVTSFDGTTVLQTISWPEDIQKGKFYCSRNGIWATLCYDDTNGENANILTYDLRSGERIGALSTDATGAYPANLVLLSDKCGYISSQRTSEPIVEPTLCSAMNGSKYQVLSLAPDAERTAQAWGVSQRDRYVSAFLVKAPASTGVLRMWRVRQIYDYKSVVN